MNPFDQQQPIEGVKNILVVGSGKGGVGKSTVSVNLAASLKKKGKKVGVLDADVYGPSLPRLLGAVGQKPELDENNKIIPIVRQGLKLMSIGFLVDESKAVVWRGPMLFKAMDQFFRDVAWGELDYLIIDLPPGTGDIALTAAQKVPINGAITVCTPQNLAFVDAKKAIDMFDQINVPHFGVVENMAYFKLTPESQAVALFPRGEMSAYLEENKIEKLAEIPFHPSVGLSGEAGIPVVDSTPDSEEGQAFAELAKKVIERTE
jgi:ATP-binding protein involved in chromosome partitioning